MAVSMVLGSLPKVTVTFPDGSEILLPVAQINLTSNEYGEKELTCRPQCQLVFTNPYTDLPPRHTNPQPQPVKEADHDYERSLESLKSGGDPRTVLVELETAEAHLTKVRDQSNFHLARLEDHIAYVRNLIGRKKHDK